MALEPLPEKIIITSSTEGRVNRDNLLTAAQEEYDAGTKTFFEPDDLTVEARTKYDAYWTLKNQRRDPLHPGTPQAGLDKLEELKASKQSTEDLKRVYGFSFARVIIPALKEQARLVKELAVKVVADIVPSTTVALVPEDVRVAKNITEFIPEPVDPKEPAPVVVEK